MTQDNKSWFYDLLWLSLLIGSLYALFLGIRPLAVPDEARYVEIPREMLSTGNFVTPHLNSIKYLEKPPLFYWLQAGSITFLGYKTWVFRSITAFLALLGCLAIYAAGRILYNRETGYLAGLITASSLLYFCMGHYITLDMAVSFFMTVSLLAFIVAMQFEPGKVRCSFLLVLYMTAGLGLLTKGLIALVLPGLVIFSWLTIGKQWHQLKRFYWFSGIGIFLLITLPWHILVQSHNPEFLHYYLVEQHYLRYSTTIAQHYQPIWWYLPIVLIGFLPWTGLWLAAFLAALRSGRQLLQDKVSVYFWLWIGVILSFYSFSNSKLIPYVLPMWPAMALLSARYILAHLQVARRQLLWLAGFYLVLASVLGLIALGFNHTLLAKFPPAVFYQLAGGILLVGIINVVGYYKLHSTKQLWLFALSHLFLFSGIMLLLPKFDTRSTKPLAEMIQPLLTPDTELIGYNHYYQDIPVYLKRRLTVVNATEELADGMRYQDASEWMINDAELKQRWQSHKVFIIVSKNYFPAFRAQNLQPYFLLAETKRDLLLSNKPK